MRIVGGIWKGRAIETPEGRETRPTTDRIREAIASMLHSACGLSFEGLTVLDAFAGSGALSLELLSRGCAHATIVDSSSGAIRLIRRNVSALKAQELTTIIRGDVFKLAEGERLMGARGSERGPYDILVLDPPYATSAELVSKLVDTLAANSVLTSDALVLYERASSGEELGLKDATIVKQKTYGDTSVDLYRLGSAQQLP